MKQYLIAFFVFSVLSGCSEKDDNEKSSFLTPVKHSITTESSGDGYLSPKFASISTGGKYSFDIVKTHPNSIIKKISGCDGKVIDNHYVIDNISNDCEVISEFETEISFKNESYNSFEIYANAPEIIKLNSKINNVKKLNNNYHFQFNGIFLVRFNDKYKIFNRTPMDLNNVVVSDDYNNNYNLILNEKVPRFSSADLDLSTKFLTEKTLSVNYQAINYLPKLTIGYEKDLPNEDTCPPIPNKCVRPPYGNERVMMQTIASNIHQLLNSSEFMLGVKNDINNHCDIKKEYSECKDYKEDNNYNLDYSHLTYIQYGQENHDLTWSVFSQEYNAEGWGSGYRPNSNNYFSTTNGFFELKDRYVNDKSPYYDQYAYGGGLYNTAIHEGGHAYGFSHWSGKTYGFGEYAEKYINENLGEKWRKTRPDFKFPELFIDANFIESDSDEMKVILSFKSLNGEILPTDKLQFEIMSQSPLNYKVRYQRNDLNDYIVVVFDKSSFPEQELMTDNNPNRSMGTTVYIRVFKNESNKAELNNIATIKFDKSAFKKITNDIIAQTTTNNSFILIGSENLNPKDNGWDMRKICYYKNGYLSNDGFIEEILDNLKETNELSILNDKNILSQTEDNKSYQTVWSIYNGEVFKGKHYVASSINEDKSILCMIPNRKNEAVIN